MYTELFAWCATATGRSSEIRHYYRNIALSQATLWSCVAPLSEVIVSYPICFAVAYMRYATDNGCWYVFLVVVCLYSLLYRSWRDLWLQRQRRICNYIRAVRYSKTTQTIFQLSEQHYLSSQLSFYTRERKGVYNACCMFCHVQHMTIRHCCSRRCSRKECNM